MTRIAVASRSFARNAGLRAELSERYAEVTFTDSPDVLQGDALIAFLRGHDRAIVGLECIDDDVLTRVPELRIISKYGVGLDGIDLDAVERHGVKLAWTGGVNRRSVSELTLAFAIALLHRVPEAGVALRGGEFQKLVGRQLTGRVVGIVGCGFVGKDLIGLLAPFGCRVLVHDILDFPEFYEANGVHPASLDQLLAEAEIVTLHVPLDASTRGMIGAAQLARMRKGACLINAARGGLVDEAALIAALSNGHLGGAAFDVFQMEPEANPELLAQPTFLGTPHIGGSTAEAQMSMGRAAIAGLESSRLVTSDWPVPAASR
jgi:phosphoglycerate dehydrogenase-like enzyme